MSVLSAVRGGGATRTEEAGRPACAPTCSAALRYMPVLLLLSGMSALVFQVTWFREFGLVFGASTSASAAVMAVFMGGLGLGSAVLGRWGDRSANPLRLYAVLEGTIALGAAVSPLLIDLGRLGYAALGGQSVLGTGGATLVRLAICALVLGLPTFLMGGTLPAAAKVVTLRADGARRSVGLLYGLNTLGAVVGASLTTFLLLPQLGNRLTLWLACLVGTLVGMWAWTLSRSFRAPASNAIQAPSSKLPAPSEQAPVGLVYAVSGGVGFAFFVMELVWYRMLGPILGGTTYTFGLILAVALAGIGIGGALYPWIFRQRAPGPTALALTCGLEALGIAFPYALGDWLAIQAALLQQAEQTFAAHTAGWALIAAITILPAALVAGVQFPLLIALCGRGDKDVGREVGLTAAWNTAGAILGSLAGGFGLLPWLTAPGAWRAMTGLLILLSAAVIVYPLKATAQARWRRLTTLVPGALAVLLLCSTGPTAAWRHSGIGAGRFALPADDANAWCDWSHLKRRQVLWEADGVESSVALVDAGGLAFLVNGKSDGDAVGDAGTQIMLGLLPALLHPNPKTGLVVGLGTGETPGWLAEVPEIDRVDVVELEPAVDEMARRCAAVNHNVLHHRKVRRIYNDAREVLLTTAEHYDIIASEPSNPYRAGIANLFTREFYQAASGRLRPDGLFVQWVQGYEIDERTVWTILATLQTVFPHVEVWQSKIDDMLLVCSRQPLSYSASSLRRKIGQEPFRAGLGTGWRAVDLEGLLSRFVAGPSLVGNVARQEAGRINTDDHNRIEYGFARTVGQPTGFSIEGFRRKAVASGAHRPQMDQATAVDWDRVEGHRQVLHALSGSIVLPDRPTPEQKARAEVLQRYWQADTRGMVAAWEKAGYEPAFPSETALLALGYANFGNDRARALIDRLRPFQPAEADAIEAYLRAKQGRFPESARLLDRVFAQLRASPWGLGHALELSFTTAMNVVEADPTQAAPLYRALESPLAVYVYEEVRRSTAVTIAQAIGPERLLEAVHAYEPHVPWNEPFLQLRLQVYRSSHQPLQGQAATDLETFRQQAVPHSEPASMARMPARTLPQVRQVDPDKGGPSGGKTSGRATPTADTSAQAFEVMPATLCRPAVAREDTACGWPTLLGPRNDGTSPERGLRLSWPETGPREKWRIPVGTGYAGPVAMGDALVLLHRKDDREVVERFDAETGKSQWQFSWPTTYTPSHAYSNGPFSTPTLESDQIYALGAMGQLHCLSLRDGKELWHRDLYEEYQVEMEVWPATASPLVEGDRLIVNVGGRHRQAGVVALDKSSGKTLWTATTDGASCSTPCAATIHGRRYVFVWTADALVSLNPSDGNVLWRIPFCANNPEAAHGTPPIVVGDLVFVSGYQIGNLCVRVLPDGSSRELWRDQRASLDSQYNNLVCLDGGRICGFSTARRSLHCLDLRTGELLWRWRSPVRNGTTIAVDGAFLLFSETGHLASFNITAQGVTIRSVTKSALLAPRCLSYPALNNGLLYLRNEEEMVCVDLRAEASDDLRGVAGEKRLAARASRGS